MVYSRRTEVNIAQVTPIPPKPVLVLDPGHGSTRGSPGFDSGSTFLLRTEAEANVEAALTLKFLLVRLGWDVRLTHDGTQGAKPDLAWRVEFAQEVGALAFVAIHYDRAFVPPRHRRGVYYAPGAPSLALAQQLQGALGADAWLEPSRLSRFGGLYIDAMPDRVPSVLVELDSIEFAPAPRDGAARVALLQPLADVLHGLWPRVAKP